VSHATKSRFLRKASYEDVGGDKVVRSLQVIVTR